MKTASLLSLALALGAAGAHAQSAETAAPSTVARAGVPIDQVVAIIAKKTGKRFVLDPRVQASVSLIGVAPSELSYADFLSVLNVYGFFAVEDGGLVRIVPDANMRLYAVATITARDSRPPAEFVCEVLTVKNTSAPQLVPILRPMMPQFAHMAAYPANNAMLLCDRFDNLRRLEGIIRTLDVPDTARPHLNATGADAAAPAGH